MFYKILWGRNAKATDSCSPGPVKKNIIGLQERNGLKFSAPKRAKFEGLNKASAEKKNKNL